MATTNDEMPHRCIFNDVDMKHFMESSTRKELLNFVEAMGKSCASGEAKFDASNPLQDVPPSIACLHGSLRQMITWIDDFPATNPELARFGNPAFRRWHERLMKRSNAILTAILQSRNEPLTAEEASQRGWDAAAGNLEAAEDTSIKQVSCYLHDSFGHATRLDYGTGHESSFLVFLLVLSKVKCFGETPSLPTLRAVTLSVFDQYLKLTRRLQTDYRLEPAGSHGVWGLDDYHCLPFYFGACQLQGSGIEIDELKKPKCVTDEDILMDYSESYLYLSCIRYIRELKKGVPFFESSPMLFDISQTLPTWDKVARGMFRLYQGEVLDKRQVVQHFVFSKLFPGTWKPSRTEGTAPIETFRSPPGEAMPPTRAPWAGGSGGPNSMPQTRAPWAGRGPNSRGPADMSPTRAPWADDPMAYADDPMAGDSGGPNSMPQARAPVADRGPSSRGPADMSPTRAPWADDPMAYADDPMAPTKAPWAK